MNARTPIRGDALSIADQLAIVLAEQLCLGWHQTAVRSAAVGLLGETLPKLSHGNPAIDDLKIAARMMVTAENALDWSFASNEVQRTLMPFLRARTNELIVRLTAADHRMPG